MPSPFGFQSSLLIKKRLGISSSVISICFFQSALPKGEATSNGDQSSTPLSFQSTHLIAGAKNGIQRKLPDNHFNPRSFWKERHVSLDAFQPGLSFSIHAPQMESDRSKTSTRTVRTISIHAPHKWERLNFIIDLSLLNKHHI